MTLAIYCAGGLGKELIELARSVSRWNDIIFVDDITQDKVYCGAPVLRFEEVPGWKDEVEFVIANGEPAAREKLYQKIKSAGYPMATLVAASTAILPGTKIGAGCIIYDDCGISTAVEIGDNVLFNGRVLIGHDAVVGAHSVVSANCFLGGGTTLESCVYMAPGSMTKDHVCIGKDAIISLGAVILRNVRAGSIMVGNPARKIGDNTERTVFGRFE